jgi:addiction module HigA family antidote
MKINTNISREMLCPPGDTIQEHLDHIGMQQNELAERMGRPKENVNRLIKGLEPITRQTAYQLENVLGIPASFWLNLESDYRQELHKIEQLEEQEEQKQWAAQFPLREMKKQGLLPDIRSTVELVEPLLKFFGVASPEEWARIYMDKRISVAFRLSLAGTKSPYALSAWLRAGELQMRKESYAIYDAKKFRAALKDAKELSFEMPTGFEQELRELCAGAGVALIYTPKLPKATISGVARWYHGRPLIQLSGRHKTDDHFWFSFFHEAGHILLHGKKDIFLEGLSDFENDRKKEDEANRFAAKYLLSEKELNEILDAKKLTSDIVKSFAHKFRTPIGAIIGRLQHDKHLLHSQLNHLKRKVELFEHKGVEV